MQRLILDQSPAFLLLCFAAGIGYAYLLYSVKPSWSKTWNRILFVLRAVLVAFLMVLLLGPILRQTENKIDRPSVVVLVDQSKSVKEHADTVGLLNNLKSLTRSLEAKNREVSWSDLNRPTDSIRFNGTHSDISTAIRESIGRYEGKNLSAIVLVSDGIYNSGLSPAYLPLRVPVFTVGVGDTTERADAVIRNLAYNRIVYQGNKFALRAEVGVIGLPDREIIVTVRRAGKVIMQQKKNPGRKTLLDFDFQLDAPDQGMQRLEINIDRVAGETNLRNNRASAFVDVVEGKKKVLLIAPAPHPDIKALRTVIEMNANYEFILHVPGLKEAEASQLVPGKTDLVIAHQSPDLDGRTSALVSGFMKARASLLMVAGQKTAIRQLPSMGIEVGFENSGQRDEVQPVLNPVYQDLGFSDALINVSRFPPVSVPFGKVSVPATAKVILHQRIGSVGTDRPLLFTVENDQQKIGVMVGDGLWRWRLSEFQETGKTAAFDELFGKLIQYLSTRDDRRKFRCFPVQQEFSSDEPSVLETQVYNDLFEPVFGNTIEIELRNESGNLSRYQYVTGPGNSRYRIGGLPEGVYRFKAATTIKGKKEEVRGEFLVTEQNREVQNLTADFSLLRTLSANTGGKFYRVENLEQLQRDLTADTMKSVIRSEETFQPLINLKAVFFVLLLLIAVEWFLRKYLGAY